ncbi:hypothetical protein MRB53_040233 [Persea americana]|nr:hypothetical protein MRB53_040233 [Persea americana]
MAQRARSRCRAVSGHPRLTSYRKGVSFRSVAVLTRFMISKKKDHESDDDPTPSTTDAVTPDERCEGADAELFCQHLDNMGHRPRHPKPPTYIKVRSRGKKEKEFDKLFLAQELRPEARISERSSSRGSRRSIRPKTTDPKAIWTLEFSKCGRYLATAGQDKVVRVWGVLTTADERRNFEKEEDKDNEEDGHRLRLSSPVFKHKPVRTYEGHVGAVVDVAWSTHADYITSVCFHPLDDRFFLAGSLDAKIRLWNMHDKTVACWNQGPDMITSVAFTPDGKTAIAGCHTGLCLFYETDGLKYQTQIHVQPRTGKKSKNSKITGIVATTMPPNAAHGAIKLLITSNDSRVRMYNLRDKSLEMKFRGHENNSGQTRARLSDDGRYVVCGSEDNRVFIWSAMEGAMTEADGHGGTRKDRQPYEHFDAHAAAATAVAIAPARTRHLLSNSEDPLYDICNPPPVTLVDRSSSIHSSQPAESPHPSVHHYNAPITPTGEWPRKQDPTPAYIARAAHPNGGVLVSADAQGNLRVFRQDCAHSKRHTFDAWDPTFSKRIIGRKPSFATGSLASGDKVSRHASTATEPGRDRILSWRQDINGSVSAASGSGGAVSPSQSTHQPTSGVEQTDGGLRPLSHTATAPASFGPTKSQLSTIPSSAASESKNLTDDDDPDDPDATPEDGTGTFRPFAKRQTSDRYWKREAWRAGLMDQLQHASPVEEGRPVHLIREAPPEGEVLPQVIKRRPLQGAEDSYLGVPGQGESRDVTPLPSPGPDTLEKRLSYMG